MGAVPNSIIIIVTKLHFVLPVAAELVKQGHIQLTWNKCLKVQINNKFI